MKHLLQPKGSSCCGQVSLAMALGVDPQAVYILIGRHRTTYRMLCNAAALLGRELGPVVRWRKDRTAPGLGLFIMRVLWCSDPHRSHFVVYKSGAVYDPLRRPHVPLGQWLEAQRRRIGLEEIRVSSWVEVK